MAKVTKEFEEIELSSGKTVTLEITVTGVYDARYGADADGNRGVGTWLIEDASYETHSDDDLDDDDKAEIESRVESIVDSEDWDFDNASEEDEEDLDDEDDLFF